MRILIAHNQYREPGGEDAVVHTEADLLREQHDVVLYEVANPEGAAATAASLAGAVWNPRSEHRLRELLAQGPVDVAHVHNTWYSLSPSILKPLAGAGIPIVVTLHNYRHLCVAGSFHRDGHRCVECLNTLPWRGVVHRCYRGSAVQSGILAATESLHRVRGTWTEYTELFVVPSEFTRNMVISGGFPADRVVVKPHHVADPGERQSPPSMSRTVVYAGRLSPDKGVRQLVDAWQQARLGGDLELVLAGDGVLRSELVALADPSIRLPGWLPSGEVARLVGSARAVVLPTTMFETFGLSAVEALAAGTPVLTTAGGAIAEAVAGCGPVGPGPGASAADWAEAIQALQDDAAVDDWGAKGRRRYHDVYDPERGLSRLLEIYERARELAALRRPR